MKGNEFLDTLEWIDPDLVAAADEAPRPKRNVWMKWGGLVACLCLVAASVYALTAPRQNPVAPPPDPGPAMNGPYASPRPNRPYQFRTSAVYHSLEALLADLRTHDDHGPSDSQKRNGGYSTAQAAMEGSDTVSYQGTVYQRGESGEIGVYQNGVRIGTVEAPAELLFVSGQRLIAVATEPEFDGELVTADRVRVSIFDLSDPADPQLHACFTQSGDLTACWMAGTQLYLLTDDGVCACGYSRLSNLEDYKPQLFYGETQIPWPEKDISILGTPSRVSYVAAVRIDTEAGSLLEKHACYGDITDVYYGQDGLALVTETTTGNTHVLQDVYTFNALLRFTGKLDIAAAFGVEKTLTWSGEQPPERETHTPAVKAMDCADGVWRMVGEYSHHIGPGWYRELFALSYDLAYGETWIQILPLPEAQFDIDDVLWEAGRAIITVGYVQLDTFETGARLAFARFDGTKVTLLSSEILCPRVTGIDGLYAYGRPLGWIRPFIPLGNGLYLRYNGTPDGFDLYDLADSSTPKCLYQSQGPIPDLPAGGRLDFDRRVLSEHTVAVKLILPGPAGRYGQDASLSWALVQVQPDAALPVTLAESPI